MARSLQKPLISQAALARELGITRQSVSRACQRGGRLQAALVGRRLDASHPAVAGWRAERAAAGAAPATATVEGLEQELGAWRDVPLEHVLDMTIREVSERFAGGVQELQRVVSLRRALAYAKRAENATRLAQRDLVDAEVLLRHAERLRSTITILGSNLPAELARAVQSGADFSLLCRAARERLMAELNGVLRDLGTALGKDLKQAELA